MTGFYEGTGGAIEPVPHDLNFHDDVYITGPLDGQILVYNADTGLWENADDTAGSVELQLGQLTDVDLNTLADGQVIVYQATTQTWVNASPTGDGGGPIGLGELTDVTLTAPTQNDRLVYDGGQWVNTGSTQSLENPVIIGDGSTGSDATLILNAGNTINEDTSQVEYHANGIVQAVTGTQVTDSGDRARYFTSVMTPGASEPTLVSLIWANPDTPTQTEFALANKTQFRIYDGEGTAAINRTFETFGTQENSNGIRVIDPTSGVSGVHNASTSSYNEVRVNRHGTSTAAITARATSAADGAYIDIDGYLNITGGNNGVIKRSGVNKLSFADATVTKMNGIWEADSGLRLENVDNRSQYFELSCGVIFGGLFLGMSPSSNNAGFLIRAKSAGGAFYDLVGSAGGDLTWRNNPVAFANEVVQKSKVRAALLKIAELADLNPQKMQDLEDYLTAEDI